MRRLFLGLAVAASALLSSSAMADDTQIADFIQSRLQVAQQQGQLRGFNVDLQVEHGTVWFKGYVSNPQQEMMILRTAQEAGYLGVVQVVDDIEVKGTRSAQQASYPQAGQQSGQMLRPASFTRPVGPRPATGPHPAAQGSSTRSIPLPQSFSAPQGFANPALGSSYGGEIISGEIITGDPLPFASAAGGPPIGGEPLAIGGPGALGGGGGLGAPAGSPNLPGYAWPGYAAHPNFGAVSYPKQYSASAWPYIGPFYPYPQVPLGWRKVSLEWDDGFWYLDFHDKTRH